jgi:uncharacterized protein (DUF433 family)
MKHERISIDPAIMVGKPCIKGTRMPVEHILRHLGNGATEQDVLNDFHFLTLEDIRAALSFAADELRKPFKTDMDFNGEGWTDVPEKPLGVRAAE